MPTKLMFGQKSIMPVEWTIPSWMVVDWMDEMNQEELLATRIQQLERQPEDVERARVKVKEAQMKNGSTDCIDCG